METSEKMTIFLRLVGVTAIVFAALNFLVSGRYDLNSIGMHYTLIGVNLALLSLGVIADKLFKEKKTATTFTALSLAMIPVHFAQLGGFILSKFDPIINTLPQLFNISLPPEKNVLIVAGVTLITLSPVIFICFKQLAPKKISTNSLIYLFSSSLILIPVREPNLNFAFALLSVIVFYFNILRFEKVNSFRANMLLLVHLLPSSLIVARLVYYPLDEIFFTFISLIVAGLSYAAVYKYEKKEDQAKSFNILGTIMLTIAYILIHSSFNLALTSLSGLVWCLIIQAVTLKSKHAGNATRLISNCFLCLFLVVIFPTSTIFTKIALMPFPVITLLTSNYYKERDSFLISFIAFSLSSILLLRDLLVIPTLGVWPTLIIVGVLLILIAGVFEKKKDSILNYIKSFSEKLK